MTFPFMEDPVPPGHGESLRQVEGVRTYEVVLVLGDGNPEVVSKWQKLDRAFEEADKERAAVRAAGYTQFFVGVMDEDDPERGWLSPDVE